MLPPQNLNLSALPSVPIIWTIRTSRQISKKTEATSNVDAVPFSHTRARILWYGINPASFIKDFPLKRWMPYYYSMQISILMQTMLFRNFFNFLFSSLIIFRFCRQSFYLFSFVFSLSGASLPLTLPHLLFFSTNYKNTHVCEEKRPGSAASTSEVFLRSLPFLSFLSSLFRSYSQFYFLSLSDK